MGLGIKIENLNKSYGEFKALENINLELAPGKIYGIVGSSGAGKSTLLRTINRLEDVDSGSINVLGQDVLSLKGAALKDYRKKVAMIFQNFALLETRSVFKNIALPLECSHKSKKEIKSRVEELARLVGLTEKLNTRPKNLSGGQRQRVSIARALALEPEILLCDEATSALDSVTTKSILSLLREINQKLNLTIVMVTHQMEVVKEVCEEIAIISDGHIIDYGPTEEIFVSDNSALDSFFKEDEILPDTGVNIKIYFDKQNTTQNLITSMARQLNIDFSISYGKLEKFRDNVLGTLTINVLDKDVDMVVKYLNDKAINFKIIKKEK